MNVVIARRLELAVKRYAAVQIVGGSHQLVVDEHGVRCVQRELADGSATSVTRLRRIAAASPDVVLESGFYLATIIPLLFAEVHGPMAFDIWNGIYPRVLAGLIKPHVAATPLVDLTDDVPERLLHPPQNLALPLVPVRLNLPSYVAVHRPLKRSQYESMSSTTLVDMVVQRDTTVSQVQKSVRDPKRRLKNSEDRLSIIQNPLADMPNPNSEFATARRGKE